MDNNILSRIPFSLGSGKDRTHYAIGFNPNGTLELFRWRKRKDGLVPNPDTGETGGWEWYKTYVDTQHAAKRLLAIGMQGVHAANVEEFVAGAEAAAKRIEDAITPASRTHTSIYPPDLDQLRAISRDTGEPIVQILSQAIRQYVLTQVV